VSFASLVCLLYNSCLSTTAEAGKAGKARERKASRERDVLPLVAATCTRCSGLLQVHPLSSASTTCTALTNFKGDEPIETSLFNDTVCVAVCVAACVLQCVCCSVCVAVCVAVYVECVLHSTVGQERQMYFGEPDGLLRGRCTLERQMDFGEADVLWRGRWTLERLQSPSSTTSIYTTSYRGTTCIYITSYRGYEMS